MLTELLSTAVDATLNIRPCDTTIPRINVLYAIWISIIVYDTSKGSVSKGCPDNLIISSVTAAVMTLTLMGIIPEGQFLASHVSSVAQPNCSRFLLTTVRVRVSKTRLATRLLRDGAQYYVALSCEIVRCWNCEL
jgi:hypothetical protein